MSVHASLQQLEHPDEGYIVITVLAQILSKLCDRLMDQGPDEAAEVVGDLADIADLHLRTAS